MNCKYGIYFICYSNKATRELEIRSLVVFLLQTNKNQEEFIMENTNLKTTDTVYVDVDHIHPHPENPRRKMGDISELAKSIKIRGVLQNLTIIPQEGHPGEYFALIGNQRHAAAKLAGLKEVPCNIRYNLTLKEQKEIMLEENILRDDLTILEQAESFQLLLELGETEESLAEKTGFSKSTIRHRLNIAKLNPNLLEKKEQDESFQLNLTDLYALERISNIKTREKILKESTNSRELIHKIEVTLAAENRKKTSIKIIKVLQELGCEEASDKIRKEVYSSKWSVIKTINLNNEIPKKEELQLKLNEPIYYLANNWEIQLIKKTKKKEKILTPAEMQQKYVTMNKKQVKAMMREMAAERKELIQNIILGKIKPLKDTKKAEQLIWQVLINCNAHVSRQNLISFFLKDNYYNSSKEEITTAAEKVKKLTVFYQMLLTIPTATENLNLINEHGMFREEAANTLNLLYTVLKPYGLTLQEEQKKLLDGSHILYTTKKQKNIA